MTRSWETQEFDITDIFGDGENVAVFGKFTYKSKSLGKVVHSPFSTLAKVKDGKLSFFQFMEDTYATASTFKVRGKWPIKERSQQGSV